MKIHKNIVATVGCVLALRVEALIVIDQFNVGGTAANGGTISSDPGQGSSVTDNGANAGGVFGKRTFSVSDAGNLGVVNGYLHVFGLPLDISYSNSPTNHTPGNFTLAYSNSTAVNLQVGGENIFTVHFTNGTSPDVFSYNLTLGDGTHSFTETKTYAGGEGVLFYDLGGFSSAGVNVAAVKTVGITLATGGMTVDGQNIEITRLDTEMLTPEPGSFSMVAIGAFALRWMIRNRRRFAKQVSDDRSHHQQS